MFDASFRSATGSPALALIEELAGQPDNARLQKSLIVDAVQHEAYDEAIARRNEYIDAARRRSHDLDVLKVAHFYTGKVDEAVRYGQRGIELRDAEAAGCRAPRLDRAERRRRRAQRHLVFVVGSGRSTATAP